MSMSETEFDTFTLPNGIRCVHRRPPGGRSAGVAHLALTIGAGTRDEAHQILGPEPHHHVDESHPDQSKEERMAHALPRPLPLTGADVLTVEPAEKNNPLLHAPNIYLTPHIAWATKEARTRLMKICTENIAAFLNGQPQNTVNLC